MGLRALFLFLLAGLVAGTAFRGEAQGPAWRWNLPAGVAPPPVPVDNPMSAAKVALGRRLFYDGRLSAGGTMSCATCHEQHRAFASATVTHPGIGGNPGRRNVPGLANVAWLPVLTWHDPAMQHLETQAATPLFGTDPVEMAARPQELLGRLRRDACYPRMFRAAFPRSEGIEIADMAKALASFQRTMHAYAAPYDLYLRGDRAALSPAAQRGRALFVGACASCHAGANFTDGKFHALGTPDPDAADRGLVEATGRPEDEGKFRTAPLRNAALTAPYLHDGSAATLAQAIRRHPDAATVDGPALDDLVAFLGALTDRQFVENPALSRPRTTCR